jgi:peptidoglycan/xylan/chitin deacetylase (PgdA/CDA1 family)
LPLEPFRNYFAVTFDDGLNSFASSAAPVLRERGITPAVFVVTERLGSVPQWASDSPETMSKEAMLTARELKDLQAQTLIGSHTATHQRLTMVSGETAETEIGGSRRRLQEAIGSGVYLFSFPYGAFNKDLVEMCRKAGYTRVFTSLPLCALADPNEFVTGRVNVSTRDSLLEFRLKILGAYRWLPVVFTLKRILLSPLRLPGSKRPQRDYHPGLS